MCHWGHGVLDVRPTEVQGVIQPPSLSASDFVSANGCLDGSLESHTTTNFKRAMSGGRGSALYHIKTCPTKI